MISLIFDCETTGKIHFDIPFSDEAQPHLVELAFELYDHKISEVVAEVNIIVRPIVDIPKEVSCLHGVTTEIATRVGVRPMVASALFSNFMNLANRFVCHNVQFDTAMMMIEFVRLGKPTSTILQKEAYCTMKNSTDILKLQYGNRKEYKWPSLDEAYKGLINKKGFKGAHRAINDVRATREIMIVLERRKKDAPVRVK